MAIYNLGSINADHFYKVPHLPKPGETLAASESYRGLGGKGANQSIAAAQAGAVVHHIGAVGPDGNWAIKQLAEHGVGIKNIAVLEIPTAHAIINVDPAGENAIVIYSSANIALEKGRIIKALADLGSADTVVLQNETNLVQFTAELAQAKGAKVIYSAAPFDAQMVSKVLPFTDLLVLNEVEAKQLSNAMGTSITDLPVGSVLITKGAKGAVYQSGGKFLEVPAFNVDPVDTTGAGDTYLGYFAASLDAGQPIKKAMTQAAAAAAIQVTRLGTADAIPNLETVRDFLRDHTK